MEQEIPDILSRLDSAMRHASGKSHVCLHRRDGKIERSIRLECSNHARLTIMAEAARLEDLMNRIPIITPTNANWSAIIRPEANEGKTRSWVEFTFLFMDFNISRPASRRLKTATEMLQGAVSRLSQIEHNCASEAGEASDWLVSAKTRAVRIIPARSAREAAWTHAALYVRNRAEVRGWKKNVQDILQISQIYPEKHWRSPRA